MICIPSNFQGPWGGWRSVLHSLLRSSCKTSGAGPCCSWVVNIRSMCLRKIFTFTSSHPIHPIPANDGSFSDIVVSSIPCNFWSRFPLLKTLIAFQCQSAKPLLVDNIDNKMVIHKCTIQAQNLQKIFAELLLLPKQQKPKPDACASTIYQLLCHYWLASLTHIIALAAKTMKICVTSNSFILVRAITKSSVLLLPC